MQVGACFALINQADPLSCPSLGHSNLDREPLSRESGGGRGQTVRLGMTEMFPTVELRALALIIVG